jgi:hypothetical protein
MWSKIRYTFFRVREYMSLPIHHFNAHLGKLARKKSIYFLAYTFLDMQEEIINATAVYYK